MLLSNNFRIRFNGAERAYLYSYDAGAAMKNGW